MRYINLHLAYLLTSRHRLTASLTVQYASTNVLTPIVQFLKNYTVSVQFSYLAQYAL